MMDVKTSGYKNFMLHFMLTDVFVKPKWAVWSFVDAFVYYMTYGNWYYKPFSLRIIASCGPFSNILGDIIYIYIIR